MCLPIWYFKKYTDDRISFPIFYVICATADLLNDLSSRAFYFKGKIHAVHMAAREGNLRDLQSALDRRKFAIARDGSSPRGATPLHVAVIFGNTAVIRYARARARASSKRPFYYRYLSDV